MKKTLVLAVLPLALVGCAHIQQVGLGYNHVTTEGLENAYFNDYAESNEGGDSEAVYAEYSQYNSSGFAPTAYLGLDYNDYFIELNLGASLEESFNPVIAASLGKSVYSYQQEQWTASIRPSIGFFSMHKNMGNLPDWGSSDQMNVPGGDFDGGEKFNMIANVVLAKLSIQFDYQKMFIQAGWQQNLWSTFQVYINDGESHEVTGKIHAQNCVGESSKNLSCSNYFDPFSKARVNASGLFINIGMNL